MGVAVLQRVELYLEDIFRNYKDSCYKQKLKQFVSKFIRGNMLVVGNLMHTGQHGIHFETDKITQTEFLDGVAHAVEDLKTLIYKEERKRIWILMFKDYFMDDSIHEEREFLESLGLHKIVVQPNMILEVKPHWNDINHYLADLNTKYRQRYKTARKKSGNLVKRELNAEDLQEQSDRLYELYKNVSDNARINTFILPKGHFLSLKLQLEDRFRVFGYYLDDTLIGFYTLILNTNSLETYFLGYDEANQYYNQLYLNMLYDMLNFAITHQFSTIVYARTAMEIKSSVGATPAKMKVYLKHTNPWMNRFLEQIFSFMNPKQIWEERHPFK